MTSYSMRGQLLFEPHDRLSILFRTHYTTLDLNNPSPRKPIDPTLPYDSPFTSYQDPSLHPWDVQDSEDCPSNGILRSERRNLLGYRGCEAQLNHCLPPW